VGAHVLRQGLLRRVADIKTTEIDSYGEGNAFFQSADSGLHETPHGLKQNELVSVGGGNDGLILRHSKSDLAKKSCLIPVTSSG